MPILTATFPLCNTLHRIKLNFLTSQTIATIPCSVMPQASHCTYSRTALSHTGPATDDLFDLRQEEPDYDGRHRCRQGIAWNFSAAGGEWGRRHVRLTRAVGRGPAHPEEDHDKGMEPTQQGIAWGRKGVVEVLWLSCVPCELTPMGRLSLCARKRLIIPFLKLFSSTGDPSRVVRHRARTALAARVGAVWPEPPPACCHR
jgi:hypothetical protein